MKASVAIQVLPDVPNEDELIRITLSQRDLTIM